MARPLRITYEGAWYHVMNRGAGRREGALSAVCVMGCQRSGMDKSQNLTPILSPPI